MKSHLRFIHRNISHNQSLVKSFAISALYSYNLLLLRNEMKAFIGHIPLNLLLKFHYLIGDGCIYFIMNFGISKLSPEKSWKIWGRSLLTKNFMWNTSLFKSLFKVWMIVKMQNRDTWGQNLGIHLEFEYYLSLEDVYLSKKNHFEWAKEFMNNYWIFFVVVCIWKSECIWKFFLWNIFN